MIKYEVDFIDNTGGWYTYDIRADSVFNAACKVFRCACVVKVAGVHYSV